MSDFDFNTLRQALETRDLDLLLGLYDPAAEVVVVNKNTPPSRPFSTEGWQELETYFQEICGRDLTHQIGDEVLGDGRVSYTELCAYPTGEKVFTANVLEIADGAITKHTLIETWDE